MTERRKTKAEILAAAGYEGRVGRPRMGDVKLVQLQVPQAVADALQARADELGITLPEVRRRAYEAFLRGERETIAGICPACKGRGKIINSEPSKTAGDSASYSSSICDDCNGTGRLF